LELARRLAAEALELEGESPRELPDAGPFAVGDQLAVAGHDLALAAAGHPEILAGALAAVEETTQLTA
jgi:hypothetical protein